GQGSLHAARVPAVDRQLVRDSGRRRLIRNEKRGHSGRVITELRGELLVAVALAVRLVLREVHLAGEALALTEDLEPGARVDRALVLDRHHELLVDAERLFLERDVRDDRLLPALVVEGLARAEQLLRATAELVELDDVL